MEPNFDVAGSVVAMTTCRHHPGEGLHVTQMFDAEGDLYYGWSKCRRCWFIADEVALAATASWDYHVDNHQRYQMACFYCQNERRPQA